MNEKMQTGGTISKKMNSDRILQQDVAREEVAVDENPKAHPQGNAIKDPETWVTKDEPMTGAQASYLQTLSEEANMKFDPNLTKAEASRMIEELQMITGRGGDAAH